MENQQSSANAAQASAQASLARAQAIQGSEALKRLVEFTWRYYLEHPEFMTLLNSENLHQARHLARSKKVRAMHSPLIAMLSEVLQRGARSVIPAHTVDAASRRVMNRVASIPSSTGIRMSISVTSGSSLVTTSTASRRSNESARRLGTRTPGSPVCRRRPAASS